MEIIETISNSLSIEKYFNSSKEKVLSVEEIKSIFVSSLKNSTLQEFNDKTNDC